ncbi:MAG: hypothetical protein HeimC2_41050 [Candidatus Heimdallarchaeota archaeon LC_2]|nr:MAG: hypothetical protein HeimC2_41050 [Candidatus Heimdallarchaeota archaeon LC_2]
MIRKIEHMDFDNIKSQLKDEVNSVFTIWLGLLENFFGDNLAYVYAKGSAIKNGMIQWIMFQ